MDKTKWYDLLFNLAISLFGGLVKTLTSEEQKNFSKFLASAVVGGFAGLLTYMICSNFGLSWQITSFATGVAGYMGDTILDFFSKLIPKFISGKFNIKIEEKDEDKKE